MLMEPSSKPLTNLPSSKGSHAKSRTFVPLTRHGVTPSGILPQFFRSNTATFPPGPLSGTATLVRLTQMMSVSVEVDLLRFFKLSKCSDLWRGFPFRCLNLVRRPNLVGLSGLGGLGRTSGSRNVARSFWSLRSTETSVRSPGCDASGFRSGPGTGEIWKYQSTSFLRI